MNQLKNLGYFSLIVFCILFISNFSFAQDKPQSPKTAKQYVSDGVKLYKQKQYDKSIELFKTALGLNPNLASAYAGLGASYGRLGRKKESYDAYSKSVLLDPNSAIARFNLGIALSNLRRFDEALAELEQARRLSPKNGQIYNMIGNIQADVGQYDKAIETYRKSIELNPNQSANYHNIGLLMMRLGKFSDAIEPFEKALELKPTYRNARYHLSNAYSKVGRFDDSVESWSIYLKLDPRSQSALMSQTWSYFYLGNQGVKTAQNADKFLEMYGWNAEGATFMAIIAALSYRQEGMIEEEKAILIEATQNAPSKKWINNVIRYLKNEVTKEELEKLAVDNDKRTEAKTYIGVNLFINGKFDEAKTYFKWVKEYGNKRFSEYPLAVEKLKSLGN